VVQLMAHLHVHKAAQHHQHVQLAMAEMVTAAQELQEVWAVTRSAVTYLAAPVLMEHLHVKPRIVALTTTVHSQ